MAYTSSQVVQAVPTGINSALVFIYKDTLTAATQHNLTNVFSTTYDHYIIKFTSFLNVAAANLRFGTAGTPDTGSNYTNTGIYVDSSTITAANYNYNASSANIAGNASVGTSAIFIDISSPFLAAKTTYKSHADISLSGQNIANIAQGFVNTTTSYTDLVLLSASNISGIISIYGYTNS